MVRALFVLLAAVAAAGCGGEETALVEVGAGTPLRPFYGLVECDVRAVTVRFDPRAAVFVEADDSALAVATFEERSVSKDCTAVRKGRWTDADGGYDDAGVGAPVRERITLRCEPPPPLGIDVHPIYGGTEAVTLGSNLLVLSGSERDIVLSAVLKNEGDPQASRIYHVARYCAPA